MASDGFKHGERLLLRVALVAASGVVTLAVYKVASTPTWGRWVSSAGYALAFCALLQLDVAGLFARIMEPYHDQERYPYGPPSSITREVIFNPDTPIRSWLRERIDFDVRTGFWLAILSTLLQLAGTWG